MSALLIHGSGGWAQGDSRGRWPPAHQSRPISSRLSSGPGRGHMEKRNLAARAGHWSATHRKTAIFGWLGFVVVAFMIGNAVTQQVIHGADQFSGESGRAETAL